MVGTVKAKERDVPKVDSKLSGKKKRLNAFRVLLRWLRPNSAMREDLEEIKRSVQMLVASQTVYMGDHEAMTSTRNGDRIYVDTRSIGIASHIIWTGKWEPQVEAALKERIRPGDTVCDFGANFGFYTLSFARSVGPEGRVIAVEANPPIYQKLKKSVHVNGYAKRVTLHNMALADRNGTLEFRVDSEYSGGGSLVFKGTQNAIQVPASRLDDLIPSKVAVNVIKMDVEGAEALVLAGGHRVFSSPSLRAIVMEVTPAAVAKSQPPRDFLAWFEAQGFQLRLFTDRGLTEQMSADQLIALSHQMMNILAERP